jgi:fucose permease
MDNWHLLALIWAIIPVFTGLLFLKTPIAPLIADGEKGMGVRELGKNKVFWLLVVMMVCSGASEQAVSQWASAFAEMGLGISKTLGDLVGPLTFAALMGLSRVFYGKFGHKINLDKFIGLSAVVCVAAYLMIALVPNPIINLIGCGLCGLGVSIMWPGTLSKASVLLKNGGTTMFALLAVAGDLGCTTGPMVVGLVSDAAGDNLKIGIFAAIAFPVLLVACALLTSGRKKAK